MSKIKKFNLPFGSEPVKNIVLVGRTGNGKSATGNSLIKRRVFESGTQATGVTMKCQTFRAVTKDGPIINVIDTPGLFDLSASADFISKEIVSCLRLAEEGLHAVVLVLSVRTRITQEEEDTLATLQVLFGSKILDYLIVLFTGGDDLEGDQKTLENYLATCPEFLTKVFRLCGNRRVLFDNRTTDERKKENQIQKLLENVAAVERCNGGIPFTDETHRKIKAETVMLKEQQRAAEAKSLAKAEIEAMKKELKKSYDRKMSKMAQIVEDTLRDAWDSQQRMMHSMPPSSTHVIMSSRRPHVGMSRIDTSSCNIL